jgi:hypothetical protein
MVDHVFLVIEGIYLRKLNLSPFAGSIVHEVGEMEFQSALFYFTYLLDTTFTFLLFKVTCNY